MATPIKATFDPSLDRPWTEEESSMTSPYEISKHQQAARDKAPLTFETKDAHGFTPPLKMVGRRLRHLGNLKVYVIFDFAWDGARDEWNFLAKEEGNPQAVTVTRPLLHIQGQRSNLQPRYEDLGGSNGEA